MRPYRPRATDIHRGRRYTARTVKKRVEQKEIRTSLTVHTCIGIINIAYAQERRMERENKKPKTYTNINNNTYTYTRVEGGVGGGPCVLCVRTSCVRPVHESYHRIMYTYVQYCCIHDAFV